MKWKMLDWCDVLVVRGESEREDGLFADNGGAGFRVGISGLPWALAR